MLATGRQPKLSDKYSALDSFCAAAAVVTPTGPPGSLVPYENGHGAQHRLEVRRARDPVAL